MSMLMLEVWLMMSSNSVASMAAMTAKASVGANASQGGWKNPISTSLPRLVIAMARGKHAIKRPTIISHPMNQIVVALSSSAAAPQLISVVQGGTYITQTSASAE